MAQKWEYTHWTNQWSQYSLKKTNNSTDSKWRSVTISIYHMGSAIMNTIDSILAVSPSIHQPGYIDLRLGLAAVDWTTQTEAAYLQKSKKSI
jgi:hypothetical protein